MNEVGAQCGICTPGMIMAALALGDDPTLDDVKTALAGNLCRCTGYGAIYRAMLKWKRGECAAERGERVRTATSRDRPATRVVDRAKRSACCATSSARPSPARRTSTSRQLRHAGAATVRRHLGAATSCAASRCAIDIARDRRAGDLHRRHSLARRRRRACRCSPTRRALVGGAQIQNRGTIGGNIANASPAGDSLPVFAAADAVVVLRSVDGERRVPFTTFYTGYRATVMRPDELIVAVEVPRVDGTAVVPKGRHARGAGDLEDRRRRRARRPRRASRSAASRRRSFALRETERGARPTAATSTRRWRRSSARSRRSTTCAPPPTIGSASSANLLRRFWSDTAPADDALVIRGRRVVTPDGVRAASIHVERRHDRRASARATTTRRRRRCSTPATRRDARPRRHARARERARSHRVGGLRDRDARRGGGRRDDARRHAAQLHSRHDDRRGARRQARGGARHDDVDVGFIGGVVPGNAAELEPLARAGVRAFKCFLVAVRRRRVSRTSSESDLRAALPTLARTRRCRSWCTPRIPALPRRRAGAADRARTRRISRRARPRPKRSAIALLIALDGASVRRRVHIVHLSSADVARR